MLKETTNNQIQKEQPNLVSSFNSGLEVNVANNNKHEKTPDCLYISNPADVLTQELIINHSGVALTPVKLNCEYSTSAPNLVYTMYLNPTGGSTATNFVQCPYFPINGDSQVPGQQLSATEGYQTFTGISQTCELLNNVNTVMNVTDMDSTCDILETALQQCISSTTIQPKAPEIQNVCAYQATFDQRGFQEKQVVYSLNDITTLCSTGTVQQQQQIQQLKEQLQQQLNCSQRDAVNPCNKTTAVEEESEVSTKF